MQSLRKPSVETQNFRCLQRFQKEERRPGWKKEGEEAGKGAKGVALQTSPATCRHPGITGLFPGLPEKGGLELGPTRNQTRKFEFSSKRSWSVSNPQLKLRPFDQIPASRTRGLEKWEGGEGLRRGQREGRGEVNKVSCSLPVGALWPVVRVRRRPGTKGAQLRPLGLVHWQASWPLSTPSGQDVSLSEEEPHQSRHLLQEGGPLPGPETGLLSNTQKWIVRGDTCWQSKRLYCERAPGWRAGGWGNPGELLRRVARGLGFYGDWISFRVVFGQSS